MTSINCLNGLKNGFKQMSPRNKFLGLMTAACAAGMLAVTVPKQEEKIPEMTNEEFFEKFKEGSEMVVQQLESISNYNQGGLGRQNELLDDIQKKCAEGLDFLTVEDLENLKHELDD